MCFSACVVIVQNRSNLENDWNYSSKLNCFLSGYVLMKSTILNSTSCSNPSSRVQKARSNQQQRQGVHLCFLSSHLVFLLVTHQDIEIRTNASMYLPQISDLLNRVPRQMLLLVKTNDLLKGIETTLQTRASSSSFINISRCCIRAMARCVSHSLGHFKSAIGS